MTGRRLQWLALAVVVVAALAVGTVDRGGPPTEAERVRRVAEGVRCPTCRNLSAADSDAAAARAVRAEIRRRVRAGETDEAIRAFLVSRYGNDILLKPGGSGVAGLVWALPVAAVVVAAAGLAVALRRWRARPARDPSLEDRLLVERALHGD